MDVYKTFLQDQDCVSQNPYNKEAYCRDSARCGCRSPQPNYL